MWGRQVGDEATTVAYAAAKQWNKTTHQQRRASVVEDYVIWLRHNCCVNDYTTGGGRWRHSRSSTSKYGVLVS